MNNPSQKLYTAVRGFTKRQAHCGEGVRNLSPRRSKTAKEEVSSAADAWGTHTISLESLKGILSFSVGKLK